MREQRQTRPEQTVLPPGLLGEERAVVLVGELGRVGWLIDEVSATGRRPIAVDETFKARRRAAPPTVLARQDALPFVGGRVGLLAAESRQPEIATAVERWRGLLVPDGTLLLAHRLGGIGQALGIRRPPAPEQLTTLLLNGGFVNVSQRQSSGWLLSWGSAALGLNRHE